MTCIFCSQSQVEVLVPKAFLSNPVDVLRCKRCKLVFLDCAAGKDELDPEETAYWDNAEMKRVYLEKKVQSTFQVEFINRLERMESLVKKGNHSLLDVGCGVGHFMNAAKKRDWKVTGLDISKIASEAALEAYGVDVKVGTLEEAPIKPATFDAITMWDVIEHIRRPLENVRAANRLLKINGILVMKTPNEAGLFKKIALFCYRLFGRRGSFLLKYVYYVPHYFSYSRRTMNRLLRQTGFKPVAYEMDVTPQEFAVEKINLHYKKDPKRKLVIALLPLAGFLARLFKMPNKMTVYARKVKEV
ncbi:class I SAM-dependent methyltransferase [Omnitrophica bacterium]|nr:class I SAM-dependent methyltransferase [Candidatus Omnitrophota bacterium]